MCGTEKQFKKVEFGTCRAATRGGYVQEDGTSPIKSTSPDPRAENNSGGKKNAHLSHPDALNKKKAPQKKQKTGGEQQTESRNLGSIVNGNGCCTIALKKGSDNTSMNPSIKHMQQREPKKKRKSPMPVH